MVNGTEIGPNDKAMAALWEMIVPIVADEAKRAIAIGVEIPWTLQPSGKAVILTLEKPKFVLNAPRREVPMEVFTGDDLRPANWRDLVRGRVAGFFTVYWPAEKNVPAQANASPGHN